MSLSIAVLDALLASGATAEQIAAVVKADITDQAERASRQVPWATLRNMAFERDGQVCGWCSDTDGPFEVDHIVARANGGENVLSNVIVSCRSCNRAKRDRDEAEWSSLHARRVKDRERKRAQRERDKAGIPADSADMSRDSADNAETTLSPFVPPKVSPEPLSNNPPISPIPEPINASAKFDLPDDIPAQPFAAFVEMRKAIGKKLTDNGKRLAVTKLRKLRDEDGWPPGEVLNHSTLNSYQGLFPPSKDRSNGQSRSQSSGVGVTGRAVAKALAGFDHGPPRTSYAR